MASKADQLPLEDSSFEVHPVAAIFPMMSAAELTELAEDIKGNGLIHPIKLSADGKTLIDGRNRLKACEMARVEPRFERLNGQDPVAYIWSANAERRQMTKGQLAMAWAKIYPDPEKGGRGKNSIATIGFSAQRLSHARTVLREAPDLVDQVIAGVDADGAPFSLDQAYETALARKNAAMSKEDIDRLVEDAKAAERRAALRLIQRLTRGSKSSRAMREANRTKIRVQIMVTSAQRCTGEKRTPKVHAIRTRPPKARRIFFPNQPKKIPIR